MLLRRGRQRTPRTSPERARLSVGDGSAGAEGRWVRSAESWRPAESSPLVGGGPKGSRPGLPIILPPSLPCSH